MRKLELNFSWVFACLLMTYMVGCTTMNDEDLELDYDSLNGSSSSDDDDDTVTTPSDTYFNTDPETFVPNYVQPATPMFSLYESDSKIDVYYSGSSAAELQDMIDDARLCSTDALMVIRLRGEIVVEDQSVSLPYRTILYFETANSGFVASDTCTATELLKIEDAEYVGIKRSTGETKELLFDGNGKVATGIYINNSGKITFENIKIADCTEYGINAVGTGYDNDLCDVIAIVQSTITGCPTAGISISNTSNPILSNNTITDCGYGMHVLAYSILAQYNTLNDNTTGIYYDAIAVHTSSSSTANTTADGLISRNTLEDNSTAGIELSDYCERVMVLENDIEGSSTGILAGGQYNRILANNVSGNTTSYNKGGTKGYNNVIQNDGVSSSDNVGDRFFNPPTISNPHNDPIRSSKSRADLTITQDDSNPIDMVEVQSRIDAFVSANSSAHVVVWLNGEFVSKTSNIALKLTGNISVVLDGRIYAAPEDGKTIQESAMYSSYNGRNLVEVGYSKNYETGNTIMVSMKMGANTDFISFSGGEVDCQSMACWGFFTPSDGSEGTILIDEVTVKSAAYNNIAPLSQNSSPETPIIVRNCTIDGTYIGDEGFTDTFRGVWLHMAKDLYCIGNTTSNHEADGFDVDAHAHNTMTLYNNTLDEIRSGVFVEEGASSNLVVGNLFRELYRTAGSGYISYASSPDTQGYCSNNVVAFNTTDISVAFSIRYAQYTVSFNNRVADGCTYGVYLSAYDNYSSQIHMDTFRTDSYTYTYGNEFFFLP